MDLQDLLNHYRDTAQTTVEQGTAFEKLVLFFLTFDPRWEGQFSKVEFYADWAERMGWPRKDIGIDLVATNRDDGKACAIQCKFHDEDRRIKKTDLDTFISASSSNAFTRRILFDTTRGDWSDNAEQIMIDPAIPTQRLNLEHLKKSPLDWGQYHQNGMSRRASEKSPLPHQKKAIADVCAGFDDGATRGQMIMACGTGKTYTSLKIAEQIAGKGGRVLYLVPSLAVLSQTVEAWACDAALPLRAFAVCSDSQVGRRKDSLTLDLCDLALPATTDAGRLATRMTTPAPDDLTVVFSTYHSLPCIITAQKDHGLDDFDLVICDEAHRTTGVTLAGKEDSNFVVVHDQTQLRATRRLYMTATPRVFGDQAKTKAGEVSAELASMDNVALYGEVLHTLSFSEAVEQGLLSDYKVIVLGIDETLISAGVQDRLADEDNALKLDDATKLIGCFRALNKQGLENETDTQPMRRAVAFCRDIQHSKLICDQFGPVVAEYLERNPNDRTDGVLMPEPRHVDGTDKAKKRAKLLTWLAAEKQDSCAILSNARCLSEGVDVPALDAVLFLHPRKSVVDVVQSVGRVMRKAPGKKLGYVILPVGIPTSQQPEAALKDNTRYKVIWEVLNALRAHDDRFDGMVNKAGLGVDISQKIEVTALVGNLPTPPEKTLGIGGGNSTWDDDSNQTGGFSEPQQDHFFVDDFSRAVMAKIVEKCGTRDYWEDWAKDIATIAQRHISRITGLVEQPDSREKETFDAFLREIRDDLNDSITATDAIEMLAQHVITRPVFDALFNDDKFTRKNPVSKALQKIMDILDEHNLDQESDSLHKFYDSVRRRVAGLTPKDTHARQQIVVELYDKFFRTAFPRTTQKLGIVYTPVEVVDFILHSVNDLLQSEFGQDLGSEGVSIIDPFTGTGTFITRLLPLIPREALPRKYGREIWANEMVLLAYYIAAINIEQSYHALTRDTTYQPFGGICLTDTFQLYEKDGVLLSKMLPENSDRRSRQKRDKIRVIIGNPPYSAGQKSENDDNQNVKYLQLDQAIGSSYVAKTQATNKNALYDSYIRALRWGSDRLKESGAGILAFVSGNGFVDKPAMDGLRKCLAEDFNSLYILNLRGDIRKNMLSKGAAKEGGNIFDSGSMTGIALSFLIKNPDANRAGQIFYHDIGDDLSAQDKKTRLHSLKSLAGLTAENGWQPITPDKHHDWINQRDDKFSNFIALGDKKNKKTATIFENYSCGLKTQRDDWCYNPSAEALTDNITRMIATYNRERERQDGDLDTDPTKISWSANLKRDLKRNKPLALSDGVVAQSCYRPFTKRWLFYSRRLNERVYQMPQIFPTGQEENRVIAVSGIGSRNGLSVLMLNAVPDLNMLEAGAQCFPRYLYDGKAPTDDGLFDGQGRRDAITNEGLAHFQRAYPGLEISKDDLFYYIYGLLHSPDYRARYVNNLSKQLPRIPAVRQAADFTAFVTAGRKLANLHVNYEQAALYPVTFADGGLLHSSFTAADWRVEKMKFGSQGKMKDKTTVIYNSKITLTDIPLAAYDYIVNGKPALEWVMERQCVTTDKASGLHSDANRYATETANDPAYPLTLFQRLITVALETQKITHALPRLDIAP